MRHRVGGRKLHRTTAHRKALFRNMVTSLVEHERIKTTWPKAKEMQKWAEKMITLGKVGSEHAKNQARSYLRTSDSVKKLFEELAPRYQSREGGYTRVLKCGFRKRDAAPMAIIEYVDNSLPKQIRTEKLKKYPLPRFPFLAPLYKERARSLESLD